MTKTKETVKEYNKEYSLRPEVIARAKIRNAQRKDKRKLYRKTTKGREAENRYRRSAYSKIGSEKHLISRYNLSLDQYNKMLSYQNNLCYLCKKESKTRLHVDHCHTSNKIRGLLCGSCNRGLGLFKDDINVLQRAIIYLQQ